MNDPAPDDTAPDDTVLVCTELSVEHDDGTTECTEPGCEVPHRLHRFTASCREVLGPCGCATTRSKSAAA